MKRFQDRKANGRFRPNTTENLFGVRVSPCACGALNPYSRGEATVIDGFIDPFSIRWQRPERCSHCGAQLAEEVAHVSA